MLIDAALLKDCERWIIERVSGYIEASSSARFVIGVLGVLMGEGESSKEFVEPGEEMGE